MQQFSSTSVSNTGSDDQSGSLLDSDPFDSPISKILFDAIDNLRGCGVGQDLDLPQLVIVGKQSAGKSSLLQSLTDIPFPVGERLCTRFATRIISRRTAQGTSSSINISIEDGDVDLFGHAMESKNSSKFSYSSDSLSLEAFKDIIQRASSAMGISPENNYSSKVLKVELLGPKRLHFGILDVPGIFSASLDNVTEAEKNGVEKMVTAYMKKPQNIVICVADSTDDVANQRIFSLAAKHVDSSRSVGVFTKCDKTDRANTVVDHVRENKSIDGQSFLHGWYVVQNRPEDVPSSYDRECEENATFSKAPWNEISGNRRGISKLKEFLARLLCRRIRESFPEMQANLSAVLQSHESRLTALGEPRTSTAKQLAYLVKFADKFHDLAGKSLTSPGELPKHEMKLRGKTQAANDAFSANITEYGHQYGFSLSTDNYATGINPVVINSLPNLKPQIHRTMSPNIEQTITRPEDPSHLFKVIEDEIIKNRAGELPCMFNPAILKPLMTKQSCKWKNFAEAHIRDVVAITKDAIGHILNEVANESTASAKMVAELRKLVLDVFTTAAEKRAMEVLETRIKNSSYNTTTTHSQFAARVQGAQQQRFLIALAAYMAACPPQGFIASIVGDDNETVKKLEKHSNEWIIVNTETSLRLFSFTHPRGEKYMKDEIHDLLEAYYKVSLEYFINYVNAEVIEPFLQDQHGAVHGLSSDYIMNLKEDRIAELAAEEDSVQRDREDLEQKIQRLREAEVITKEALRKTGAVTEVTR